VRQKDGGAPAAHSGSCGKIDGNVSACPANRAQGVGLDQHRGACDRSWWAVVHERTATQADTILGGAPPGRTSMVRRY
jgi:hypothetical protein